MSADIGIRTYTFSSLGGTDNLDVKLVFDIHEDEPWFEIHRKFVDFLQANGFVFSLTHPIREVCGGN